VVVSGLALEAAVADKRINVADAARLLERVASPTERS
jgi:hypothetical protein